jgi:hypothetical protein
MKMRTILAVAIAIGSIQPVVSRADDLFQMAWRGKMYTTGNGQVVTTPFTEQSFVNTVAHNNGLNPSGLVFVYRPNKRDTVVVRTSNGQFIADVIQMEFTHTDISNSSGSYTVRQAFLFDEYHTDAIGSAIGTEWVTRNAQGAIVGYNFIGQYQIVKPEIPQVGSGWFWMIQRIKDTSGG